MGKKRRGTKLTTFLRHHFLTSVCAQSVTQIPHIITFPRGEKEREREREKGEISDHERKKERKDPDTSTRTERKRIFFP